MATPPLPSPDESSPNAELAPGKRLPATLWTAVGAGGEPANDRLAGRPAVAQVRLIALADVAVPEGRTCRQTTLELLKDSIASAGLLQPIVVDPSLRLLCGYHRLEACRSLGWQTVPAVVQALDGAYAKLAEIDENLCRHELSALERGEHTALRKKLYQELRAAEAEKAEPPSSPRPKKGKAPKEADPEALAKAFLAETAQRTGRSRAQVAQDVKIGELDAEVRTMLHETPLKEKKSELVALTKMPVDEQREAVARVKAGEAKSVRPKKAAGAPDSKRGGPSAPTSLPAHPFAVTLLDLREVTTTLERVVDGWPSDDNADYRELVTKLRAALDHLHDVRKRLEAFAPASAAE
ncbi:MAG TPA: ParB/RepB/Spo0J family partition protein [Polyangiaceae bacterium]|nr:ParB/RepB/Spo0J family partition protein [Polyangiaceae bacterium]